MIWFRRRALREIERLRPLRQSFLIDEGQDTVS